MTANTPPARYGSLSIALHWLMLVLIVAAYACIELREFFPKGSAPREGLKAWHFMLGLTVFALLWMRLVARVLGPVPPITPAPARLQAAAGHAMHLALYLFMLAMPLAGWLILGAEGKPVPFWGLELPPLVGRDEDLAKTVEELHELGGTLGYWLVGLHAAAALWHHYLRRDDTLTRILPWRARR